MWLFCLFISTVRNKIKLLSYTSGINICVKSQFIKHSHKMLSRLAENNRMQEGWWGVSARCDKSKEQIKYNIKGALVFL